MGLARSAVGINLHLLGCHPVALGAVDPDCAMALRADHSAERQLEDGLLMKNFGHDLRASAASLRACSVRDFEPGLPPALHVRIRRSASSPGL